MKNKWGDNWEGVILLTVFRFNNHPGNPHRKRGKEVSVFIKNLETLKNNGPYLLGKCAYAIEKALSGEKSLQDVVTEMRHTGEEETLP